MDPGPASPTSLDRKYRQAAFAYLHVGLLYEFAVYAMWRRGLTAHVPGHPAVWLAVGGVIVALVVWTLWRWRNPWFPRVIWAVHSLRLPALIGGAFLQPPGTGFLPSSFYLVAVLVIVANLWMLARAGWDL